MPDEVPMVTSCPLCLAPDEVSSMVTIEIDRAFGGGLTSIMICRSCAGAVLVACDKLEPPLLYDPTVLQNIFKALRQATEPPTPDDPILVTEREAETQAESAELHEGEEPDDGKATD